MALIKCSECEREISDQSSKCVHCGYQLKVMTEKTNKFVTRLIIISLIVALIIFGGYKFIKNQNKEAIKQQEIDKAVKDFDKTLEEYKKNKGL